MPSDPAALKRAAWVYALRSGWTESERADLSDAEDLLREVFAAYGGQIDEDLLAMYGHELEAPDA